MASVRSLVVLVMNHQQTAHTANSVQPHSLEHPDHARGAQMELNPIPRALHVFRAGSGQLEYLGMSLGLD